MEELEELIKEKKKEGFLYRFWWMGLLIMFLLLVLSWLWFFGVFSKNEIFISPEAPWFKVKKPLEKYSFENLKNRKFETEKIEYKDNVFKYKVGEKIVSGQINIPSGIIPEGGWPVVIMIRGFVDPEIYETGMGTRHAGEYFTDNGLVTLAPDFLGFGESDNPPNNVFEERFLRVVQILQLLADLENFDLVDENKISIWGHSNGGQLALSVLEISGKKYPTSLWAPVSKPFPYSILYYTDEFDDYGKALRKELSGLEAMYDVDDFSISEYYDWIKAPIQIHQGTNDDAVALEWSQDLHQELDDLEKDAKLFVYNGADHNLVGGWDLAIYRSLEFFSK